MNEIEKRARELLVAEFERDGLVCHAQHIRNGEMVYLDDGRALRAIIAALTPPEDYVLVPVDLLQVVAGCAYPVSTAIDSRGYAWSEAYLDQMLPIVKAAMAAARPQVKP